MAKLYTLDDKLLTEVPEVRVGRQGLPGDNRQKTVMAIQRAMEQTDAEPAAQMSAALRLALGEQAERELAARDLPYRRCRRCSRWCWRPLPARRPRRSSGDFAGRGDEV